MKRAASMLLAMLLSISLAAPARAEDDLSTTTTRAGGKATSTVELTAEAAPFSVTVPSGTVVSAPSFADVEPDAWYSEGVSYCAETGLVEGYDDDLFHPLDLTTRGMLVQVLYNLEGCPSVDADASFADVSDERYAPAVRWAMSIGIIKGYSDGTFGADDELLREQLVTILYRYAQYKEAVANDASAKSLDDYADAEDVSTYAQDAMTWAIETGIVIGTSSTTISPLDSATRAEIATIMARYVKEVGTK